MSVVKLYLNCVGVDSSPNEEDSGGEGEEVGGEMQRLKQRECSDWPVACDGGGGACVM